MVKWSPEERIDALDALKHPFILEGLPKNVRTEHMKQMNSNNPYNLYWFYNFYFLFNWLNSSFLRKMVFLLIAGYFLILLLYLIIWAISHNKFREFWFWTQKMKTSKRSNEHVSNNKKIGVMRPEEKKIERKSSLELKATNLQKQVKFIEDIEVENGNWRIQWVFPSSNMVFS